MDARTIELMAADALLDAGISLPIVRMRIPWLGERSLRVTMRRPYLGTQLRIARIYLKLGKNAAELLAMTEDEEMEFIRQHGVELSRMLALTICRGWLSGILFAPIMAWLIRWRVPRTYQLEAQRHFRKLRSTRDFMNIIVWAEKTNPYRPETSHATNGSNGRIRVKTGS